MTAQPLNALTLPLTGMHMIEASAGTGKTWTIELLYVRLILGHGGQPPLMPTDILVVTYTRAATGELRERIRSRLRKAATFFRASDEAGAPDDGIATLRADWPAPSRASAAWRLDIAAASMDEAAIYTIHGWAQRMLSRHAFSAGSDFETALEPTDDDVWQEACRDFWRAEIYPLTADMLRPLPHVDKGPDALWPVLRALEHGAPDAALLDDLKGWACTAHALETAAQTAWATQFDELATLFSTLWDAQKLNRNSYRQDAWRKHLDSLHAWSLDRGSLDRANHKRFAREGLAVTKHYAGELDQVHALDLLQAVFSWGDVRPDVERRFLSHARHQVYARVVQLKSERGRTAYDDLLGRLDTALQSEALCASIRQCHPVALIDEFQDTDPTQYRVFKRLYHGVAGMSLLMIGDPKQAIYGFRGADVYTYLQARRDCGTNVYSLTRNFRSAPALVEAVNHLFQRAEDVTGNAFGVRVEDTPGIPFHPVSTATPPTRLTYRGAPYAGLSVWFEDMPRRAAEHLETFAEATASHVVGMLNGDWAIETLATGECQPLKPADIALLVRDRREADTLRKALARRRLPSAYLSERESVFDSPEARDMRLWLEAIAEPASEERIRRALATPTLHYPLIHLDLAASGTGAWEDTVQQFFQLRECWQRYGILVTVRRWIREHGLAHRLLHPDTPHGERSLTNVLHLAELLQQASATIDGLQGVIRHLSRMIEEPTANDDYVQRLERDDLLIRIVTIHKSKGLEYPVVFLPYAGRARRYKSPAPPQAIWHDEAGERHVTLFGKGALPEAVDVRLKAVQREEAIRLLYVALTRARHACFMGMAPAGTFSSSGRYTCDHRDGLWGYFLQRGGPVVPGQLQQRLTEFLGDGAPVSVEPLPTITSLTAAKDNESTVLEPAREPPHTNFRQWRIDSYSSLGGGQASPTVEIDPRESDDADLRPTASAHPLSLHEVERGPGIGVFIHSLFESMAQSGFARFLDPVHRRAWLEAQCLADHRPALIDCLDEALPLMLQAPLGIAAAPELSLASLAPHQVQAETGFLFEAHDTDIAQLDAQVRDCIFPGRSRPLLARHDDMLNGLFKGFIDLVFEHDGKFYVLDYKFNYLGPDDDAYTPARLQDALLEKRYDLQLALYSLALHRLLKSRMPGYRVEDHFGGALCMFLRGTLRPEGSTVHIMATEHVLDTLHHAFRHAGDSHAQ